MIQVGFRRHELPDTHALSVPAKDALSIHRRELQQAMRAAGASAASQRIARLFQMFTLIGAGENVAKLVENYTKAVERQPLWAIDTACMAIQRSGADYRPSEPKFLALVMDAVQPAAVDLLQITDLLHADIYHVPDEAERDRVSNRFKSLLGELGL